MTITARLIGLALAGVASSCWAHHSMVMFDRGKSVTLQGTVRQFQWTNPHCYIQLLVASPEGSVEWSIEMNSPGASYREGWRPGTLQTGDALVVVINPVRDGTHGGRLVQATDTQGRKLNTAVPRP